MHRCLAAVLAPAALAVGQTYEVFTYADATYTTLPIVIDDCRTTTGSFCTAEALRSQGQFGEAYGFGGYQEVAFGSDVRAIARAFGAVGPFGPPSVVKGRGMVDVKVVWDTASTGLPPGAPIRVRAILPFTGALAITSGQPGTMARALAEFTVWEERGPGNNVRTRLFHADAVLDAGPQFTRRLQVFGDWQGDFVPTTVPLGFFGQIPGFELDTFDVVRFDTFLGRRFQIDFVLDTYAEVPRPSEIGAVTDFGNTGSYRLEAVDPLTNQPLPVTFTAVSCPPDCDGATGPTVLDIFDFLCFQNKFDAGTPYACDFDTGTGPGVCDIFDFLAFQNAFSAGCP